MGDYIKKKADLPLEILIVKSTSFILSTKGQTILVTQKQIIKQVGLDLCSLPEVDGYRHFIFCIDYLTKWWKTETIRDKTALTVAMFLCFFMSHFMSFFMCCHGCFEVQINDQASNFVNGVCTCLHDRTLLKQRISSAYYPESNGLVERQNRTIKNALVKVLDTHPQEWPHIIEGVLFAHRVSRHSSIKY